MSFEEAAAQWVGQNPREGTTIVDAPFSHGTLAINRRGDRRFSDADIFLLERFTEVFALAYSRFEDLQAAEERAREADLDRARQRVRGEVMSMKQTEDIENVVAVMRDELNSTGVACDQVGINIIDEAEGSVHTQWSSVLKAEQLDGDVEKQAAEGVDAGSSDPSLLVPYWREGKVWSRRRSESGSPDDKGWLVDVPFEYGTLAMNRGQINDTEKEFAGEEIDTLGSFAEVVALGYTRFLDFQRLEEQNRALESANAQVEDANRLKSDTTSTSRPRPSKHLKGHTCRLPAPGARFLVQPASYFRIVPANEKGKPGQSLGRKGAGPRQTDLGRPE